VLKLLHACLDRPFAPLDTSPFFVLGPFSQAKIQTSQYKDLERYLLLMPDQVDLQLSPKTDPSPSNSATTERLPTQLEIKLLDFCLSELERTRQRWKEWTQKAPQNITSDMLRIITNFCIVASALGGLNDADHRRVHTLESAVDAFMQSFSNFLGRRETDQYKLDVVIESCMRNLPDVRQLETLSPLSFRRAGVLLLANSLTKALESRSELKQSFHVDNDFMDDEVHNSQVAGGAFNPDLDVPRHDIQAESDFAALRANCSAYFHLISYVANITDEQLDYIPPEFVSYVTSLPEAELLRCRRFVTTLLSTRFRLQKSSCLLLLEHLGEVLIDPTAREYNTSEVANGMVVEVLIGTINNWDLAATDKDSQNLCETVEDLYTYYVKGMEKNGVRRSPNLQKSFSDFLHGVLKFHPDFGQSRKFPSVRTSLFELLANGEIAVKYHIAERLPTIFEYFILPEHDKILEDVDASLPSDTAWTEGLAIRLLVLARLASEWHTLLRQGVYRIFATAGSVERTARHAEHCINRVAKARKLESPQALFRLFAPQIIFTWLDRKRKFSEIPFIAFDYTSLEGLLRDVESEAVGQAIMLGRKDEVEYLAQALSTSAAELLTRNIGKAAAYTISWDTCKGVARNKADVSTATLLRELIGDDQYGNLIQQHFPRVVGYIIQTMDHEERIAKPLEKRPAFSTTAKALAEMNNFSHSTQNFDLGIEPSFNAYYLFDQLERLCRRIRADPVAFWEPNNYTFVLRMLLDRLHPALGSLQARSVIRKVRILVALAGKVACEGYPLQMTLQSLRPFLTDVQCAEDTFGIVQYLFDHGTDYLRSQLSFMTGIGLSILISIRVLLGTSQESTTQESQYTATMHKAGTFHSWLTRYLNRYAESLVPSERGSSIKAFKLITSAASRIRTEGNSHKGSEESQLLLQILDDVRSNRNLLNKTSREVALNLLCQNFQPASSVRDDVLNSDAMISEYAPLVWESCQRSNIGDGYLLWAARVLGRAFSAHGVVKRRADESRPWPTQPVSSRASLGRSSREAIIGKIVDLFYSDDRRDVSLAERAIRALIAQLSNSSSGYVEEVKNKLPESIGLAMNVPIPAEPEPDTLSSSEVLEHSANPTRTKPVSVWIRDLAVSLCHIASRDPILSSLPRLLLGIHEMAAALFPYILHLVLLDEFDADRRVRQTLSEATMSWFSDCDATTAPFVRLLIQAVLYLRSQPVPRELTRVDRDHWLEIDFLTAAQAAARCGMYRSALLFAETHSSQPILKTSSKRSSVRLQPQPLPLDLQLSIYKNLDEPDSFYGVDRGYSLSSVLDRLDHEANGVKSFLFRGARLDSQIRRANEAEPSDSRGMVRSLINLNMNSITHSLLSNDQFRDIGDDIVDSTLHTARKLGQWDIIAPEGNHSESSTLFKAFQGLHFARDISSAQGQLGRQLLTSMKCLVGGDMSSAAIKSQLRTLAVLAEADEFANTDPRNLNDLWEQMKTRERWMRAGE
jgi:ataxia telangiectasia mutated family protein